MFLKNIFNNPTQKEASPINYLTYAISEIALIIIGILLAVNIDSCVTDKKNNELRCEYSNELLLMIKSDIEDVKGNIQAFEMWNPIIQEVIEGWAADTLTNLDSLFYKLGTVGNYIHFQQGSATKIDELKYSNINLIPDRKIKNKILKYQNETIAFLRDREKRYDKLGDDLRAYYLKNFIGFNYGEAYPNDIEKLKRDKQYITLISQRLGWNGWFENYYTNNVLIGLVEIESLIEGKINADCE